MIGLSTTRGSLLRGVVTNALGDDDDTEVPVRGWTDFPLSVIEKTRRLQDPSTGTWRSVAYLAARVPANLPVQDGDRIRDKRAGVIYAIDDMTAISRGIGGTSSLSLELRQTSA